MRLGEETLPQATILPLGDQALLVRFGTQLTEAANHRAIALARCLADDPLDGIVEIDPNLISVLVRFDPQRIDPDRLAGDLRLVLSAPMEPETVAVATWDLHVRFGGESGPDLDEVAQTLGMTIDAFIAAHNQSPLRVLATGFAPGFVYCGFHPPALVLPRRRSVRQRVPPGTVLFAAGQTAIAATSIPTGWHVIGQTDFRNFDARRIPPTLLREGAAIRFLVAE